jgi:hypothetical protein
MKKLIGSAMAGASWLLLSGAALAQEGSELPPPGGPQVGGIGGSIGEAGGVGGSAFTGGEVAGLILAAVLLLAIGATTLVLARRRRAASVGA